MKMKKVLATTLAAVMVMACAVPAFAAPSTEINAGVGAGDTRPAAVKEIEAATVEAGAPVTFNGVTVVNTMKSIVLAKSIKGAAITLPKADIVKNLSLAAGQTPKVVIYDFEAKKSPAALASVNAAVEAIGGKAVSVLDIDLSAVSKGKKVVLKDGSVPMLTGLPKDADTSKTYVVVCVQPGGTTTVLEDLDTNPKTVTFAVQAGQGTYAVVAK